MKIRILLLLLLTAFVSQAQIVTIPDAGFKAKLLLADPANTIAKNLSGNYFKIDANSDSEIQETEAAQVSYLDVSSSSINSVTGISSFTGLVTLNVSDNTITSLDLTMLPSARQIDCSHNALANLEYYPNIVTLDASYNVLQEFSSAYSSSITSINISNNALTNIEVYQCNNLSTLIFNNNDPLITLTVANNLFTSLAVANFPNLTQIQSAYNSSGGGSKLTSLTTVNLPALFSLQCNNNNISNLDLSGAPNIGGLYCNHNNLFTLNLAPYTSLVQVDCSYNHISSLSTATLSNIINFDCLYNSITTPLVFSNASSVTTIDCSHNGIPSLAINGCTNLRTLNASSNALTTLDASGLSHLETLNCSFNILTSVNTTGLVALQSLKCNNNQLSSLNVNSLNALVELYCNVNQLSTINLGNLASLSHLDCSNNLLTTINVTTLPALVSLYCSSNQLTAINIAGLNNLIYLFINYNSLTDLTLSNLPNLGGIQCMHNQLASINITNLPTLNGLNCSFNVLTSLNLANLPNTLNLNCNNNLLTTLDLNSVRGLYDLQCNNNLLETLFIKISNGSFEYNFATLDFSGNPTLHYICADEILLPALQTKITQYGYTNCTANSYCTFLPSSTPYYLTGTNRFDSNSNGCDAADMVFANMKFTLTSGSNVSTVFAAANGQYTFPVTGGITVMTPKFENAYFSASPSTASISFPTQASPYTQNFCISRIGNHNDLEITLIPLNQSIAGFDANYKIVYRNKGTGIQSGSVNMTFNGAVLQLTTSNPVTTSQTTNNLTWAFSNLAPFESREILFTLNLNSPLETPPLVGGELLNFTATIVGLTDETPIDNTASLRQIVANSHDPNDKICLEGATVSPTMIGQFVHYLIRFENTGTANAHNIVVKDIIDTAKFDIASLVPLSGSHVYTTRIINTNRVEFIFENINLPFDDAHNDGYLVFKIKLKSTLVTGNTFSNAADIFFDYNAAVTTNNFTSTLQTLGIQNPDTLKLSAYPNPVKDSLTFETPQTIIKVEVYDIMGRIVNSLGVSNNSVNLSGLQKGTYLVKAFTSDTTDIVKIIKE